MSNRDSTLRVWVDCLHCYNSGRLVGEWFDAVDADEVTLTACTVEWAVPAPIARNCGASTTRTCPCAAR
ncbi:antirestriction protein ArdA [Glutamicibacter sp. V16R2B1]|uniref:antirestriction protein ArdA n=1 Tax=Glutamicibacter sp. V16R2B1 TaxID=2036207 RepID=UPI0024B5A5C3|nr:antirestriction protein ArdA [Glutamicibacter sp. V16R2B1]